MSRESTPLARAKRPRTPLAGPYGHPFHPILVTIPIGTWTASFVFDIIGFFAEDPEPYAVASRILILIGLIGAVVAAVWGLMDLSQLHKGTPARRTALIHMALNLAVVVLFLINLLVRLGDPEEISVVGFILTIVALLGLVVSGWLGGKLAYHYGVRVADEATQAEGFRY
jgi:uncharacterized membrane protein